MRPRRNKTLVTFVNAKKVQYQKNMKHMTLPYKMKMNLKFYQAWRFMLRLNIEKKLLLNVIIGWFLSRFLDKGREKRYITNLKSFYHSLFALRIFRARIFQVNSNEAQKDNSKVEPFPIFLQVLNTHRDTHIHT